MKHFLKKEMSLLFILLACMLCACTNPIAGSNSKDGTQSNTNGTKNTNKNSEKDIDFEGMLGNWTCIAYEYDGEIYIAEDNYSTAYLNVYFEGNQYKADYEYSSEGYSLEIYGKAFEKVQGSINENSLNQSWYANYYYKDRTYNTVTFTVTLADADTIELYEKCEYPADEYTSEYSYVTRYIYKKSDSDLETAINLYRYREEITVSNVKDLYNALGSNRKIILKEGTYNFSELSEYDKDNKHVNWRYDYLGEEYDYYYFPADQAYCYDISNLILEGEEGADVHICTGDWSVAPLVFQNSSHITLKNLRVGHVVEPGMCAGAVIDFESVDNINIENCRLYGCGTYGITAQYAYNANIKDCDIYECTYGLISLSDCSYFNFENVTMRDSSDIAMFYFYSSTDLYFKNCVISNNNSAVYDYNSFIEAADNYGVIQYENCKFINNKYSNLYEGDVEFINCTFDDNK